MDLRVFLLAFIFLSFVVFFDFAEGRYLSQHESIPTFSHAYQSLDTERFVPVKRTVTLAWALPQKILVGVLHGRHPEERRGGCCQNNCCARNDRGTCCAING
ncbi:uncharacterized protein LOC131053747 [Cryptomeria japonica]|uniref:uncharacterized protein LOC131053747 n=1 Tax=Cryptomeria japonica TaxID=3369 RepID=UPI0025AD7393|nr:uncharacterized protein LOC131053747 [Cryptomeria japonica]